MNIFLIKIHSRIRRIVLISISHSHPPARVPILQLRHFSIFFSIQTHKYTHIPLDGVKFKNRNLCNMRWYARMKLFDPWKSSEASKTHSSSTSKPTSCMFTKHRKLKAEKKVNLMGLNSTPSLSLFFMMSCAPIWAYLALHHQPDSHSSSWDTFLDETFYPPAILPMPITVHPSHLLLKLILNVFFFPSYYS